MTYASPSARVRVCMMLILLGACVSDSKSPLPEDTLATTLEVPEQAALRIKISELPDPLMASVVLDLDDGLGADEAAVLAVLLSPSLAALRAERGIRSAELLSAGLLPDPTLGLAADVPTGGVTAGAVTGYSVGLDWALSELFGRATRKQAAGAEAEALDLDILWQESLTAASARGLVYGVAAARAALALLDERIGLLTADTARARAAVDAGQLTRLELGGLQASLAAARTARAQLAAAADASALELSALIGLPPTVDIELEPLASEAHVAALQPLQALLSQMESRRLDLIALRRGYESQEARVHAAVLGQFPQLSLGPVFSRDTGDLQTLGLGIGIQLPIFGRARSEIARQRATREALAAEYTARVHAARASIASEMSRYDALGSELLALEDQEREQASQVELLRGGLAAGFVDVLSFDQAQRDLLEVRAARALAQGERRRARARVEVLAGQYWPSDKSGAPEAPGSEQR